MATQVLSPRQKKTEQKTIEEDEPLSSERIVLDYASHCYEEIAVCAYFKAEKRNFISGYQLQDWLEAEKEIKRQYFYRFCT